MRNYYRGEYGDTQPVRVLPAQALDFDGRLRAHHYGTEVEAWAAILGGAQESQEHAEKRYRQIEAALDAATDEMVKRRATMRDVARKYEEWRRRHPQATAV